MPEVERRKFIQKYPTLDPELLIVGFDNIKLIISHAMIIGGDI